MNRAEIISKLISTNKFRTYVEIGIWKGDTLEHVAKECPSLKKIFGIDPLKKKFNDIKEFSYTCSMNEPLKSDKELDKIYEFLLNRFKKYGDKLTILRTTSEKAAENFDKESLDLVFIDGIHLYDYVKQDIKLWFPKIKKGGILMGHDYGSGFPGVAKAVNELIKKEDLHLGDDATWWCIKQ